MFHAAHEPLADTFIQPRIEPELAFVLGRRLAGPGLDVADAARAVDHVLPALEIVDSRIRDWRITIFDTVADNASSGAVILGETPVALADLELSSVGCRFARNGIVAETGTGAAVLGSPLNALVWLANAIGAMGIALEAGHVVMSGSMTRTLPIVAGDIVTATFDGLGSVTATLAGVSAAPGVF
jgi:2-keto-4-pentenoate hydratase